MWRAMATRRRLARSVSVRRTLGLRSTWMPSSAARSPRSTRERNSPVMTSGCSSMMMWPASLMTTCSAPGTSLTMASLWSGGVRRSCIPLTTSVSMPWNCFSASCLSCSPIEGRKSDITVKGVPKIMSPV